MALDLRDLLGHPGLLVLRDLRERMVLARHLVRLVRTVSVLLQDLVPKTLVPLQALLDPMVLARHQALPDPTALALLPAPRAMVLGLLPRKVPKDTPAHPALLALLDLQAHLDPKILDTSITNPSLVLSAAKGLDNLKEADQDLQAKVMPRLDPTVLVQGLPDLMDSEPLQVLLGQMASVQRQVHLTVSVLRLVLLGLTDLALPLGLLALTVLVHLPVPLDPMDSVLHQGRRVPMVIAPVPLLLVLMVLAPLQDPRDLKVLVQLQPQDLLDLAPLPALVRHRAPDFLANLKDLDHSQDLHSAQVHPPLAPNLHLSPAPMDTNMIALDSQVPLDLSLPVLRVVVKADLGKVSALPVSLRALLKKKDTSTEPKDR